jgi:hypothetical protein
MKLSNIISDLCRPTDKHCQKVYGDVSIGEMDPLEYGEGVMALYCDISEHCEHSKKMITVLECSKPI